MKQIRIPLYNFLLVFLGFLFAQPVHAQINLNGVLQNYIAAQTTQDYEFIAARNRIRLQLEKSTTFGGLQTELDLIHTFDRSQEIDFLLKEAYFDWYLTNYDIRIGHQKILWGRANGTFVTDIISPVDLREFLTISSEDIRFGITSFNLIRYIDENSVQLVVAPFFQRDLLPGVESRWFPAQQITDSISPIPVTTDTEDLDFGLKDIQAVLRFNLLSPDRFDLDLFFMRWTHPTPAYDIAIGLGSLPNPFSIELIESYQNSWMAGISSTIEIESNLFFLIETLYVNQKLFTEIPLSDIPDITSPSDFQNLADLTSSAIFGDGFLISKPWIHSMAGIRSEFYNTTIEAQYFVEGIFNYQEEIIQEQFYKYATFLAARPFLRNRLQLLTLSRYNFNTKDYWFQLQGQYELIDNLQFSLGTNLFGGNKLDVLSGHLSFSQFRENSFIFSKIALYF